MIKQLLAATVLAGIGLSATSYAAEPVTNPFYAGVDAGVTKDSDSSHTRGSYGAYLGYNFNQNIAVEGGVRRLYSYEDSWTGTERADQYSLSVVGSLPLNEKLSVFGRVGANHLITTVNVPNHPEQGYAGWHYRGEDTHLLLGLGANYKLTDKVSGRVELQSTGEKKRNLSVGLQYAF